MATSTSANASSPASISPVGPPPQTTTACSVKATRRPASAGDYAAQPGACRKPTATKPSGEETRGVAAAPCAAAERTGEPAARALHARATGADGGGGNRTRV